MYFITQKNWVGGCRSNIGLLLRMLWVVVCFQSRRLTICKHGLFAANRWAKCPWNMPYKIMFTNSEASAMGSDNNSQLTQYQSNVWRKQPLCQFFWKSQYAFMQTSKLSSSGDVVNCSRRVPQLPRQAIGELSENCFQNLHCNSFCHFTLSWQQLSLDILKLLKPI